MALVSALLPACPKGGPMIRPLRKREREAHRAENFSWDGLRIAIALDRENQPGRNARERVVQLRAHEAGRQDDDHAAPPAGATSGEGSAPQGEGGSGSSPDGPDGA